MVHSLSSQMYLSNKSVKRSTWFSCPFYRNIHRTPILKLCNMNIGTQLNSFKYCSGTLIILFNINHLFTQSGGFKYCYLKLIIQFKHTVKEFKVLLFDKNNSIQHYKFIWTQLNGSKYCNFNN